MFQQIAPRLRRLRIVAVGSGLEKINHCRTHPKMEVKGFVNDLTSVYREAMAVVAPIFSGGGMKVKIAEALMHGKLVIASPFAAIGYEACGEQSIRLALSADDFEAQIFRLCDDSYNQQSRADYEKLFSLEAGLQHVREIIASLKLTM